TLFSIPRSEASNKPRAVHGAILISCGFSYRDQHINEVIDQSLRANPTASVHALLYGSLTEYEEALSLSAILHNLTLLAQDSASIGGIKGTWARSGSTNEEGPSPTTCELGDFVAFGSMLQSLTGHLSQRNDPRELDE
ncbi:hypothetical protein, partial [Arthrobacter sp. 147(2020)]|uniref:hypothetical protein n=2 Tax=unclassified Arthrobacter TaxID=235627 RepID=UPI0019639388